MIDINMGCPQKRIVKTGAGAALMKDPLHAARIVETVVRCVKIPVTVKMRLGWDEASMNAPEFAKTMEEAGASLIVVHGRTASQMFSGTSDWRAIRAVKESVSLPVIANGDILSGCDAARCLKDSAADGIMIGRGMLGRPWVFSQIVSFLSGNKSAVEPGPEERLGIINHHMNLISESYAEPMRTNMARKHLIWYTKGLRYSSVFREMLHNTSGMDKIQELAARYFAWLHSSGAGFQSPPLPLCSGAPY